MLQGMLERKSILVVEDEFLIADVLRSALELEGAHVLGPFASVDAAMPAVGDAEVALLDVNINGGYVYPLVDRLMERAVPIVLTTGYDTDSIPPRYAHLPQLLKPVLLRELFECLQRVLGHAG